MQFFEGDIHEFKGLFDISFSQGRNCKYWNLSHLILLLIILLTKLEVKDYSNLCFA